MMTVLNVAEPADGDEFADGDFQDGNFQDSDFQDGDFDLEDDLENDSDDIERDKALDAIAVQGLPEPPEDDESEDDDDVDYDYYSDYSDTYAAYALSGDSKDEPGYPTEPYTQFEPDGEDAADVYRRSSRPKPDSDD